MPGSCVECKKEITSQNQRKFSKCADKDCDKIIHVACMSQGEIPTDGNWHCGRCGNPSMRDLLLEIRKLHTINESITKSLESCHEKIDENNALIKDQDIKIRQCLDKVEELQAAYHQVKKENLELKEQLNQQEQYSRLNSIEIGGIPEEKQENTLRTISMVFRALNVNIEQSEIDCCYRMPNKENSQRAINVKFVSRLRKEEVMAAKRGRPELCLQDLDVVFEGIAESKNPIFINESLTRQNQILFKKCREFKKEHKIRFLWVKNGKNFMRKSEGAKVFVISSINSPNDVH